MVTATPSPPVAPDSAKEHRAPPASEVHIPAPPLATADQPAYKTWAVLSLLGVLVVAGWLTRESWLPRVNSAFGAKAAPPKEKRVVPVVVAPVTKHDMNLYLNGLGTVTALKTVTIRSRVDGEIVNIAFTEGQLVNQGDLLAEIDRRPFEVMRAQAEGQLERDEAALDIANINLVRLEKLAKSNAIPMQELQNQQALVAQTEAMIATDKAVIANAELQLTYCHIVSPISGRIGLRLVDLGNIIRANDSTGIAVVTQLQPIAVIFTISQDEIPRVQKRMKSQGQLEVEIYDRGFTTKLATGKLLATDSQVDSATGTLRIKALVDEGASILFPNQFVNVRLLVDTRQQATIVPSAAVQRGPTSTFVYVVNGNDEVELRNVVQGPSEGTETCIETGLEPGEIVVTEGLDKLQGGAKVSYRDGSKEGKGGTGEGRKKKAERAAPEVVSSEQKASEKPTASAQPAPADSGK